MVGNFSSQTNKIFVVGDFGVREMQQMNAAMHNLTHIRGYQDLELDFSGCTSAFCGQLLGVVASIQNYLKQNVDVSLTPPSDLKLRRLFSNTNWAHLIDFCRFSESSFRGYSQIPTMKFNDEAQHFDVVSTIMKTILGALSDFDRDHLRALEWSNISKELQALTPGSHWMQASGGGGERQFEVGQCS